MRKYNKTQIILKEINNWKKEVQSFLWNLIKNKLIKVGETKQTNKTKFYQINGKWNFPIKKWNKFVH